MNKIFILSILLSLKTTSVWAVENRQVSNAAHEQKLNLLEMKHRLDDQGKKVIELTREMNQIEINLGMQNKKYLKMSDARMKLEETLSVAKKNADLDALNLKKNYNETKAVLMGILLNKLEKTESPSDILARKILVTNLQNRMVDLDSMMKANSELQKSVDEIYKRLEDSVNNEKELVAIMNELEQRKKEIKANIDTENLKKETVASQFDELKNKVAMEKDSEKRQKKRAEVAPIQVTEEIKVPSKEEYNNVVTNGAGYRAPLYLNLGIEHNQKGVTFKFQGKNEVLATKAGKIVYTGALANYGNVIMIDHGNDTRSVILGQFDINVKNGEAVRESQILGYTNTHSANGIGDGKIYFEVRKNNLAQNTYLLIDKKTLSR